MAMLNNQMVIIYIDSHGFRVPMISPVVSHGDWMRMGQAFSGLEMHLLRLALNQLCVLTVMTCNNL